jgi:acyl-CoA synthetase (AMP-forming)/AMP-acid ligase II
VAVVTKQPGFSVSEADLIAHCKRSLSSFKVPKRIDFVEQLPMSSFGKILRREVRTPYWERQSVQVYGTDGRATTPSGCAGESREPPG